MNNRRKRLSLTFLFLIISLISLHTAVANNQIEFSEVMYRPVGAHIYDQFVELVVTADSISLRNVYLYCSNQIQNLIPENSNPVVHRGYVLLFCTGYTRVTGRYEEMIPDSVPRWYVNAPQLGDSGISMVHPDTMTLFDSTYQILAQTVTQFPCTNGHSLERKLLQAANVGLNWFISSNSDGTPGTRNSVSPPLHDIGVVSTVLSPLPGNTGNPVIRAELVGNGEFAVSSQCYARFRRFPVQAPLSTDTVSSVTLAYGASRLIDVLLPGLSSGPLGWIGYEVTVHVPDDNPGNDTLSGEGYLWHSITPLVTEWMCLPNSGEPQWLEFAWQGPEQAQFAGWKLRVGSYEMAVPFHDQNIATGSRFVLSAGTLPARYVADPHKVILIPSWHLWGTSGADVSFIAPWGQVVEQLPFTIGFPITPTTGRSLIRRNWNISASTISNWYLSADSLGASPTSVDAPETTIPVPAPPSIVSDNVKLETKRFAPQGVTGLKDKMVLSGQTTGGAIVTEIYDLSGLKRFKRIDTPPNGIFSLEWNGRDDGGALVATGVYIVLVSKNGSQLLRQSVVVVW